MAPHQLRDFMESPALATLGGFLASQRFFYHAAKGRDLVPRIRLRLVVDSSDADRAKLPLEHVAVVAPAVTLEIKCLTGRGRTDGEILAPVDRIGRVAEVNEVLLRRGTVAQRVVDQLG